MHELFHHWFAPHHTNNHRARALHHDALFFYVLLFAVFNIGIRVIHKEYPNVLGYAVDIRVDQLLASTNAKRQQAGLSTLTLNPTLSKAAAKKANDMFTKDYWAHIAPDGTTPWDFITGSGYRYTMAGENLAKNFSTSDGVVEAWMASTSHRDNLLKPGYKDVGFAVVNGILNGEETTLVVQMFGTTKQIVQVVPKKEPVVTVPEVAQTKGAVAPTSFLASEQHPAWSLPAVSRVSALTFAGFLLLLFTVDAWIVARKRIVRLSGHTLAHTLFLIAVFLSMSAVVQGVIL